MFLNLSKNGFGCLKKIEFNLNKLQITPNIQQARSKNILNRPRLRNPFWFVRKDRVTSSEQLTQENKTFVREVLYEKYGLPVITKGVQTFAKPVSDMIKLDDMPKTEWKLHDRRTGLIAKKIGQYPLWKKDGTKIRTTLLQIVDTHVIKYIPPEEFSPTQKVKSRSSNKFGCLLIGAESTDPTKLTKEYCGLFKDSGVMPKKILSRFIISPSAALPPGTPLNATHFRVGDFVDIRGKTIDRGFQGVCKRHGFKGMPASHGVTKTHRRPGNIGSGGAMARVMPGTKLPGHMGNRYRIMRGLRIWRINTKYNVLWVTGSTIPGNTNSFVYMYDTMLPLRKTKVAPPFPTSFEDLDSNENLPEDIWFDELHDFKEPSIFYKVE